MSVMNTGMPEAESPSVMSWRVRVLPVPVAPATSPWRLSIPRGIRTSARGSGVPSSRYAPRVRVGVSKAYPSRTAAAYSPSSFSAESVCDGAVVCRGSAGCWDAGGEGASDVAEEPPSARCGLSAVAASLGEAEGLSGAGEFPEAGGASEAGEFPAAKAASSAAWAASAFAWAASAAACAACARSLASSASEVLMWRV